MSSILSNVTAMAASRQLGITSAGMQTTIERLTTGKRINRASDDAAGLASADNFDATSRAATQMVQTNNNTYFAAQAGDGYLSEATTQVQRLVELTSGGNATAPESTSVISNALTAVQKALSAGNLSANTSSALNTLSGTLNGDLTSVPVAGTTDATAASAALTQIDTARADFAATMSTTQSAANLYGIQAENATSQKSNVMDANVGNEVVNLTKWQVLSQAGTSALSSANSSSQYILALFR